MKGFNANIEKDTLENSNFRKKVLYTGKHSQLVLMNLAQEEIGMEVHSDNDQFFVLKKGKESA